MNKCAIIFDKKKKINTNEYNLFIGVERGSGPVSNLKNQKTMHISDFDSSSELKLIKKKENIKILKKDKQFVDGEEAIIMAIEEGYEPKDIDLIIPFDISSRPDHFINMVNLTKKYGVNMMNEKILVFSINEYETKVVYNVHTYLSIFITENTIINTSGLKWNINNKEFNISEATMMISNKILKSSAKIFANKKIIIIQSSD